MSWWISSCRFWGSAPVGVVLIIVGVPEMALGLAAVAEGAADMAIGTHLMSDGKGEELGKTKGPGPLKSHEKAITTKLRKSEQKKKLELDGVNLKGKSFNSGRKILEKKGFKRQPTTNKAEDSGRRTFRSPNGKSNVHFDPKPKGGRWACHWHFRCGKTDRSYGQDGKPVNNNVGKAHIPSSRKGGLIPTSIFSKTSNSAKE